MKVNDAMIGAVLRAKLKRELKIAGEIRKLRVHAAFMAPKHNGHINDAAFSDIYNKCRSAMFMQVLMRIYSHIKIPG